MSPPGQLPSNNDLGQKIPYTRTRVRSCDFTTNTSAFASLADFSIVIDSATRIASHNAASPTPHYRMADSRGLNPNILELYILYECLINVT